MSKSTQQIIDNFFNRALIGFPKAYDELNSNFPFYNIRQLTEGIVVELALAGWDKEELEVTIEGSSLVIKGERENNIPLSYIHQGITNSNFTKRFNVSDDMKVKDVSFENGLLTITLKRKNGILKRLEIK